MSTFVATINPSYLAPGSMPPGCCTATRAPNSLLFVGCPFQTDAAALRGAYSNPATRRFDMMDHFNATVKDGKLVKTRRGMQVSRQKFNGLSFVNASPREEAPGAGSSGARGAPSPAPHEIKFVEEDYESQSEASRRRDAGQRESPGSTAQGTRRRRRVTPKRRSPAASSAGTSSQPSPTPFEIRSFQLGHTAADWDMLQADANADTGTSAGRSSEPDSPLSDDGALFDRHFTDIPRHMFPYEDIFTHNPARAPDFYSTVAGDLGARHCVLMCGSVTEAVAAQTETRAVAHHIAKICAILNQKLSRDHTADSITLCCISSLAWVACTAGRLDHWHLHMSGLKKVLDLSGGMGGLPPWVVYEVYKSDLKGAVALASTPYIAFSRRYSSISSTLVPGVRDQIATSLSALLNPLHVHPDVITSLSSVAMLASAIRLARQSHGTVAFDPYVFTEEGQALTYALLTQPGPLRVANPEDPDSVNPYSAGASGAATPLTDVTTSTTTENYMSNHRLLPSAVIAPVPTTGPAGNLEAALRIAALLYLKELLPEWPRNLGGYAVLLSLLRHHLREIIRRHRHGGQDSRSRQPSTRAAAAVEPDTDPLPIDPALTASARGGGQQQYTVNLRPRQKAGGSSSRSRSRSSSRRTTTAPEPQAHPTTTADPAATTPLQQNLVPVITFLCLVGDTVSRLADVNEGRHGSGTTTTTTSKKGKVDKGGQQQGERYESNSEDEQLGKKPKAGWGKEEEEEEDEDEDEQQQREDAGEGNDDDDEEEGEGGEGGGDTYPRGIYHACLREIAGLTEAAGVGMLRGEGEEPAMAMVGLFDLGGVFGVGRS